MRDWRVLVRERLSASGDLPPGAEAIVDELAQHLDDRWRELCAEGRPDEEAAETALREIEARGDLVREVRRRGQPSQAPAGPGRRPWSGAWQEIRHATRSLIATPGFTLVALTVMVLGMGSAITVFSLVDAAVLRPLPYPDPDRLVLVGEQFPGRDGLGSVAPQNFLDWGDRQDVFDGLAATTSGSLTSRNAAGEPESLPVTRVSAGFFRVLGVTPLHGRFFTPDDEAQDTVRVAVVGYGYWQSRLGGVPDVVGREIETVEGPIEIVGVTPEAFAYPPGATNTVWLPYIVPPDQRGRGPYKSYYLSVIARLRDGVSLETARSRMQSIAADLRTEWPDWFSDGQSAGVAGLGRSRAREARPWLLMLLAAVGCVLLVVSTNVATLLLVRASSRSHELGVRAALGATRWDLVRPLLTESLVLCGLGGLLGVLTAWWAIGAVRAVVPDDVPGLATMAIDARVLVAALSVTVVAGVVGAVPSVLQFSRPRQVSLVAGGGDRTATVGRATHALRGALVVAEVAIALVLTIGAGLFLSSFLRVTGIGLGFETAGVIAAAVSPPGDVTSQHDPDVGLRRGQALLDIVDDLRSVDGVQRVAASGGPLPLSGGMSSTMMRAPELREAVSIQVSQVSPDYFATLDVPVLAGRPFSPADRDGNEPVVILNQRAVDQYFGGRNVLGQLVSVYGERRVVGVVGDVRHWGPEEDVPAESYLPLAQPGNVFGGTVIVRTTRDPAAILPAIRRAVWRVYPEVPPGRLVTLDAQLENLLATRRFNMLVLSLFGALGLIVAAIGIYGVIDYVVTQRTREFGIRLALGASMAGIVISVLRRVSVWVTAGVVLGLAGAWLLGSSVEAFLFEVSARDVGIYTAAAVVLAAVGLAAAILPARRATRVDPLVALRSE